MTVRRIADALAICFLARYSLLVGIVLLGLAPFACWGMPGLLGNVLVLDGFWHAFNVTWISILVASMVVVTQDVTLRNARSRFLDYRRQHVRRKWLRRHAENKTADDGYGWNLWQGVCFVLMAIVLPTSCAVRTWADPSSAWPNVDPSERHVLSTCLRGELAAAALATVFVVAMTYFRYWLLGSEVRRRALLPLDRRLIGADDTARPLRWTLRLEQWIARRLLWAGPGYTAWYNDPSTGRRMLRLAPGHALLLVWLLVIVSTYAVSYWLGASRGWIPSENSPFPALFFGLMVMLLMLMLLTGGAFFLDYYRVPVTLTLGLVVFAVAMVSDTDHYYDLVDLKPAANEPSATVLTDVAAKWELPRDVQGKRTLVVVTASGGGIQASAWTARVLTGLHERYGNTFSKSVRITSGVSGGSVGLMYYVINREDFQDSYLNSGDADVLPPEAIANANAAARASGLEAAAWGIAYPDLTRLLVGNLVSKSIDRGWAVEQVWRSRMRTAGAAEAQFENVTLADLNRRVVQGQFPIAIFNATLVESGRRLLFSPVAPPQSADSSATDEAVYFQNAYPHQTIRLSTAVRLSATFPFVSPICKPSGPEGAGRSCHVADGGYSDNEGAVTAVAWTRQLLEYFSTPAKVGSRPFDRVLIVRIHPFPANPGGTLLLGDDAHSGWYYGTVGPEQAMLSVRTASQTERGNLEFHLLTQVMLARQKADEGAHDAQYSIAQSKVDELEKQLRRRQKISSRVGTAGPREAQDVRKQLDEASQDDTASLERSRADARAAQQRRRALKPVEVQVVDFAFDLPQPSVVPLSWKLTAEQQRNIDRAWEHLIDNETSGSPLAILNRFFAKRPPVIADSRK